MNCATLFYRDFVFSTEFHFANDINHSHRNVKGRIKLTIAKTGNRQNTGC